MGIQQSLVITAFLVKTSHCVIMPYSRYPDKIGLKQRSNIRKPVETHKTRRYLIC